MATYSVAQAAEQFEALAAQAERGDEVVLTRGEHPVLKLVGMRSSSLYRQPGGYPELQAIPDRIWAPLTDEELEEWHRPL